MRIVFFIIILLTSLRINAQSLSKKIDSLGYKDSLVIGLSNQKKILMEINKPLKKNNFNFFFGKEKEVIYRDNFTNRLYFQNGFDRTLIYQKTNTTK